MKPTLVRPEAVAASACLLSVILLSLAYVLDHRVYMAVLNAISVQPWGYPFIDWEWVPSSVHCWAQGVDVYVANTCYGPTPTIKFAYSPLMLRAGFLPTDPRWTMAIGLAMAIAFSLSLLLLRAPRTRFAVVVMVLTAVSSETAFALERGNVDVLAFLLAIAGVLAWAGARPARLASYALFTFGGLMKFYPLVLLVLALRERRRDLVLIALVVAAVLAVFLWLYGGELIAALHGVPGGSPFFFWVGAMNLPTGIAPAVTTWLGLGHLNGLLPRLLWAALCGLVFLAGALLATRGGVQRVLQGMPVRDQGFLLAGALLMGGCFATGESNGYRAILLIPAVPGLLFMSRALPGRLARGCFTLGCIAAPFVMWAPGIKQVLYRTGLNPANDSRASAWGMAHFVLNELAWWWLMALLLSAVIAFVLTCAQHLTAAATPLPRGAYEAG